MPKGVRLKPEQIVAKLREIEVKIGQDRSRQGCTQYLPRGWGDRQELLPLAA